MQQLIRNISLSFVANLFSFFVSVFMVMVVPKLLSVEDYGAWQLFLFYYSYLGFLHLGWEDGIYLRYAGKSFDELDSCIFSGQFFSIILFQIFMIGIVIIFGKIFINDPIKFKVLFCTVCLAPFVNFNNLCNFIMQITNRIKSYAQLIILERLVFLVGVAVSLFYGLNHFEDIYHVQIFSIIIIFIFSAYLCRRLIDLRCLSSIYDIMNESYKNISVGIKLMIANVASMLIIGVIRYGISVGWDISTFGRISLTLGISNFLMVFITSMSIVFFPVLKRIDKKKMTWIYIKGRNILDLLFFFLLVFYYPLKDILSWWLPQYHDSLIYMAVLLPICLFESKVSLLINTYLKSMRKEGLMLKINVCSVVVAIGITLFTVEIWHNLNATVFSIVFLYAFRCELAENCMEKLLDIRLKKDMIIELVMVGIFILSGVIFDSWWSTVIYGVAYLVYLTVNRSNINFLFSLLR